MGIDSGIDGAGNFVVTWAYDNNFSVQKTDVYARRYNSVGIALGPTFLVNTYIDSSQDSAKIAVSESGSFVIVWRSVRADRQNIAGRRYDAVGNPVGDEFQVNTQLSGAISPDVTFTPGGGFIVTWDNLEIMGRSFGPNGVALGPEFQVSQPSPEFPISANVGADRNGNSVISWIEYLSGTGDTPVRVLARRYAPSGIVIQPLTNGQVVSPLAGPTNSWRYFRLSVPPGQTTLDVAIFGGIGDADLYIRYGALPTLSTWDVRPFLNGNNESVRITNIPPGEWYIGIQGFIAYDGLALQATSF